jgi:hypothetical protein
MSRSTPSGPWNVGKKLRTYVSTLTTPGAATQIGTVVAAQKASRTYTASTTLAEDFALVLPANSKLLRISTVNTTTTNTVVVRAGITLNGAELLANTTLPINTALVRTTVAGGVALTSGPADDVTVYVRFTSTAALAGTADVIFEYMQFADATQVIAAPQV